MLSFACGHCGRLVFFENTVCLHCSTELGFVPERMDLVALDRSPGSRLHRCANAELAACNWIVTAPERLCRSCELTRTRPSDADPDGLRAFAAAEARSGGWSFSSSISICRASTPSRLRFDLLSSRYETVVTGHADGVITLDLAESDDARRERRRA